MKINFYRINPDLLLIAAQMLLPTKDWKWEASSFGNLVLKCWWWEDGSREHTFDPTRDARELQLLLMDHKHGGWQFSKHVYDKKYVAKSTLGEIEDECPDFLLLRCIAITKNIDELMNPVFLKENRNKR